MARLTVEGCLDNVENRFQLVLVAAKRARQLVRGSESRLDWENDKPTVVALREIEEGYIDSSILNEPDRAAEIADLAAVEAAVTPVVVKPDAELQDDD